MHSVAESGKSPVLWRSVYSGIRRFIIYVLEHPVYFGKRQKRVVSLLTFAISRIELKGPFAGARECADRCTISLKMRRQQWPRRER